MTEHRARKRFGQHFLHDPAVIESIVAAVAPQPGEHVVEIGPGLGALTEPLLERIPHLHVVEIDRDVIAILRERHGPDRLTIHEGDVLAFDFATLPAPLRVVGNLPYNISTPLLFHLAAAGDRIRDLHVMLQKEVVDRMVAAPGTPEYGRLSVMIQYRFEVIHIRDIGPGAFRPPPKVTSAVVRMVPRPPAERLARDEARLGAVVTAAFTKRRKTLRNALGGLLDEAAIRAADVDPTLRPEALDVAAFVRLANQPTG